MTKSLERAIAHAITNRIAQVEDRLRYAVYASAGLSLAGLAVFLPLSFLLVFPLGLISIAALVQAVAAGRPTERVAFWSGLTAGLGLACIWAAHFVRNLPT